MQLETMNKVSGTNGSFTHKFIRPLNFRPQDFIASKWITYK